MAKMLASHKRECSNDVAVTAQRLDLASSLVPHLLNMFARVSALFLIVPFFVSATAVPHGGYGHGGGVTNQCNSGTLQCCNTLQDAHSGTVASLLGPLEAVLGPLTGQVGLNCIPVNVLGIGGNSW
ncbi:hypothetical protein AX15_000415 [Amanita polypyramis BW_CC]|nr:hypothetical protein AX15_000415 [Amanita polypyramis BW_CC]